jgi:hypothetical protein
MSSPMPLPDDIDHEAEETLWQHYCAVAKTLDVGELVTTVCEQIRGEPGDTALSDLLEEWLQMPQWDWQHPLITPMQAERVGRFVTGVCARVVERAIAQALARGCARSSASRPWTHSYSALAQPCSPRASSSLEGLPRCPRSGPWRISAFWVAQATFAPPVAM